MSCPGYGVHFCASEELREKTLLAEAVYKGKLKGVVDYYEAFLVDHAELLPASSGSEEESIFLWGEAEGSMKEYISTMSEEEFVDMARTFGLIEIQEGHVKRSELLYLSHHVKSPFGELTEDYKYRTAKLSPAGMSFLGEYRRSDVEAESYSFFREGTRTLEFFNGEQWDVIYSGWPDDVIVKFEGYGSYKDLDYDFYIDYVPDDRQLFEEVMLRYVKSVHENILTFWRDLVEKDRTKFLDLERAKVALKLTVQGGYGSCLRFESSYFELNKGVQEATDMSDSTVVNLWKASNSFDMVSLIGDLSLYLDAEQKLFSGEKPSVKCSLGFEGMDVARKAQSLALKYKDLSPQ